MMNLFRLVADTLHLISFAILILKIRNTKNVIGISYRSQELMLVVFLTRYWDLFLYFVSIYNSVMKCAFITLTLYIISMIKFIKPYCLTYDNEGDNFNHYMIIYPLAGCFTYFFNTGTIPFELSWSFSIWLEALAIIPQLNMIRKLKEIENITENYVAALGFYRFFYILNWAYKYHTHEYVCPISVAGGILQTFLFADFLFYYLKSRSSKYASLPL